MEGQERTLLLQKMGRLFLYPWFKSANFQQKTHQTQAEECLKLKTNYFIL